MRATVVVFVACAVAMAAGQNVRIKIQEERISRLSNLISELEDMLDEKVGGNAHEVLVGLQTRLDDEFGGFCPSGQYSCSGDTRQCISELEVCDTVRDCENGHDEDSSTCVILATAGSSFTGGRIRDACSSRQPYEITAKFYEADIKDWFPARPSVSADVILRARNLQFTSVASLAASGSYNYARRSLYLDPPEDDGLGMEFVFDTGDADSVDCFMVIQSTGERCAHFVLYRD